MKNIIYLFLLLGLIFNPLQVSSQEKEKYLSSANKSFKKGDYNNAQKALNIYINHYKGDVPDLAYKIQQCMTLRKKAEDAIAKQQIADAIEYYRCILAINYNDPIAKKKIEDLETSAINDKTGTLVYNTVTYYNGDKYVGYFLNNKRHGQGTCYWTNGDRYEGEWKDDKRHGQGTYYWTYGDRYEGEWKDDKRHGQGIYYWNDGDKYVGFYVNDEIHGQGTYYWANGNRYEGTYVNKKRHGYGTFYWANGDRYEGEWKDGKQNGQGIYDYNNGDRYEGEWKDGKKHGQGTYYNKSNNTITKEIWNNGIFERNL